MRVLTAPEAHGEHHGRRPVLPSGTHDFTPPRSLTARRGQGVALMAVERDIFILLRLPRG